ncbi:MULTISPECIES: nuclease-related domain-containing protein [unclassified Leifsonia]|uniref:nuclease-related domain-containing protein n=1 Tax=unclassified Leifsonia TaxID=2663824 RepID=UPI0006F1EDCF|nr:MULTISPECIES: nuclease-related domain-containing protein [unclassified Leifsonia]KQX08124.1 hypothetical protein ASC59_10635 [Leifsonia sp. Root1293]KRA12405.1 hypothetical protein ASD61_10635 [Leifsonia sp. Root60]
MTALSPEVDPARTAATTLRSRAAGASVITRCLAEQSQVPDRGRLARVLGRSPLSEDSRSWYLGALGELAVATRLRQLGPDWTVLHSVPVGRGESDIDHVVIGPSGVYTINTKHHDDARVWVGARKLLVNGQPTDYLRNARHEAERATRLLSAASGSDIVVRPVIALVGAKTITVKQQPSDVMVLADTQLVRWLRRRRRTPALETTPVVAAAEHPSTWHSNPTEALADANLEQFATLQHEVRTARDVRAIWLGAVAVSVGAVAVTQLMPAIALMLG